MPYFSVEIYQEKSSLTEWNSWLLVTPKAKFYIFLWTTNQPTVTPEAKFNIFLWFVWKCDFI